LSGIYMQPTIHAAAVAGYRFQASRLIRCTNAVQDCYYAYYLGYIGAQTAVARISEPVFVQRIQLFGPPLSIWHGS